MNDKGKNILLVEDNLADAKLTMVTIKENLPNVNLNIVTNGIEAIDFLTNVENNSNKPDLILLDINLPKKNGFEVLSEIKQNPFLKSIPVIMLTSSKADEDISLAYNLHANCYITKPLDFIKFVEVVKSIENFWFNLAKLPKE